MTEAERAGDAPARPNVARYTDYRAYLRAMYTHLKATRRGFSYRSFARRAGFASGSFLKLVIDGRRNLSPASIQRVAEGLGLDREETEAFEVLVNFGQAKTDEARARYYQRLSELADRDPVARLERTQYEAYSRWYPFVIRELVALPGFREDPEWIGRRLRPKVRPTAVSRALDLLGRLGLVVRDAAGRLRPAERTLSTGALVRSLAVRTFHRQMLELAIRALDRVPREERNVSSVTVALDPDRYQRALALIGALRRELLQLGDEDPAPDAAEPLQIYHLTLSLIPVTQEVKE